MGNNNLFNSIKLTKPKRNVFDLSHDVKLSCNMGSLVPTCILEVVPGDKFTLSCESLLRFAPMVAPMMHRVDCYMHYFFVPCRILWNNWELFITNTPNPDTLPAVPYVLINSDNYTKLMDYMGIPAPTSNHNTVQAMPFAAYQKVYDEYYRDQNMIDPLYPSLQLEDGDNSANTGLFVLRQRAWEHDYFTSCLPFAQKGAPVTLPITGFKDVEVKLNANGVPGGTVDASWSAQFDPSTDPTTVYANINPYDASLPANLVAKTSDLDEQAATINDLRRAFRLQEWLEKAARGGSRYIENILSHFGVRSSDKRLQRPEYITGTKSPVVVSEVLNTTGTVDAPQGTMAGHGLSLTAGKYGKYYAEEHGFIVGIMSIMPKTAYQQGIQKMWQKYQDPFQHYWPEFANIGEQTVQNDEVYSINGDDIGPFGYVPRYAEYKFMQNRVAGDFRSSLDFWHMGRIFNSAPSLNQQFIESDPTFRVFAVTDDTVDHMWCHILHKITAVRGMPKFGTPSF